MPRSRPRRRKAAPQIRREAGYAILEAMPPLIACGFFGTLIAAGLMVQSPSSGGDVTPAATDQQAVSTDPTIQIPNDPNAEGDRPTPQTASQRYATATRTYEDRRAASVGRTGTAFHGIPGSDYSGNGVEDLLIAKPRATNDTASLDPMAGFGTVEVWYKGSTAAELTLTGLIENDLFGLSAKSAGDLDGDGADDIIVGAMLDHGDSGLEGAVYVYSGSDGALLLTIIGEEWEYLGRTVAGASDVDGDGQWDIAASSWVYENYQAKGMVNLLDGSDGSLIRTYTSDLYNDGFGYEVVSLGDLDGDTRSEIAVSASLAPGDPRAFAPAIGRLHIFEGMARGTAAEHFDVSDAALTIYNPDPLIDHFAVAVERTSDQDSDGIQDLMVTSLIDPYDASLKTTTLQVYSSVTGNLLWPVHTTSPGAGRDDESLPSEDEDGNIIHYGYYTTGLDINGDTTRDLKVEMDDLTLVSNRIGTPSEPGNPVSGDLSLSGNVDLSDLNIVIGSMSGESVILDFVDDIYRLLGRWSALDPYQYGDYVTGGSGRAGGKPGRGGGASPSDPVFTYPDPYFPGVHSSTSTGSTPCDGFKNHPECGVIQDCIYLCCGQGDCGPTDPGAGGGKTPGGSGGDANDNGIPDGVDCSEGGVPVRDPDCANPCEDDDGDGIPNQYDCDSDCFDERYAPKGPDGVPCLPCEDDDEDGVRNQDDCDSPCFYIPSTSPSEWEPDDTECRCRDTDEDGTTDRNEDDDCDGIPNHLDCDSNCYEGDPDCCELDPITGIRPQDDPESDCSADVRVKITVHRPKSLDPAESPVTDADKEDVGVQLFENLDNDDRDGEFDTGLDDTVVDGENDMCKVVVTVPSEFTKGTLTLSLTATHGASALLWKHEKKYVQYLPETDVYQIPDDLEDGNKITLWLEGTAAGTQQRTVTVQAILTGECDGGRLTNFTNDQFKATVLGVESLAWEGIGNGADSAHPNVLDNDPNWPSAQMSAGGVPQGLRVFPGARYNDGVVSAAKNKVKVRATLTTNPVEPIVVYLKSFDVDDPTAHNNIVDSDSLGAAAEDNRGTSPGSAGVFVDTGSSVGSIQVPVSSETGYTDFWVTMQPGDNFRIVASLDEAFLVHITNNDGQLHSISGQNADKQRIVDTAVLAGNAAAAEIPITERYASTTLTVWRLLHVEVDSMGAVVNNTLSGNITSMNTGDSSTAWGLNLDVQLGDGSPMSPFFPSGRFQNGSLVIAGGVQTMSGLSRNGDFHVVREMPAGGLNICSIPLPFVAVHTGPNGVSIVEGIITEIRSNTTLQVTASVGDIGDLDESGGIATLHVGIGSSVGMAVTGVSVVDGTITVGALRIPVVIADDDAPLGWDVPDPDTSGLEPAFAPAYVLPKRDLPGEDSDLVFIAHVESRGPGPYGPSIRNGWQFDNIANEANPIFWVVYIRGAFQDAAEMNDHDPDYWGADPNFVEGDVVWGIVDTQNPGADRGMGANIYMEVLRPQESHSYDVTEKVTVVHEVGHLFHGDHDDGGVMAAGAAGEHLEFTSLTLNKIRSMDYP